MMCQLRRLYCRFDLKLIGEVQSFGMFNVEADLAGLIRIVTFSIMRFNRFALN